MSNGSNRFVTGAVLGFFLLLFVVTFAYTLQNIKSFESPRMADRSSGPGITVSEGAELIIHFLLSDGQLAKTEIASPTVDLIGQDLTAVQAMKPGWNIVSFTADRLVVHEYCPETDLKDGFLLATDGYVGIYSGEIEGCRQLVELTTISVDALPENVRSALQDGIKFHDPEDLPQLIDALKDIG